MDTCVRNKMYKEALDLTTFANVLETRHLLGQSAQQMTSSRIIADIVKDVRRLALQMRGHLLDVLSSDVQLPTCLKVAVQCSMCVHACVCVYGCACELVFLACAYERKIFSPLRMKETSNKCFYVSTLCVSCPNALFLATTGGELPQAVREAHEGQRQPRASLAGTYALTSLALSPPSLQLFVGIHRHRAHPPTPPSQPRTLPLHRLSLVPSHSTVSVSYPPTPPSQPRTHPLHRLSLVPTHSTVSASYPPTPPIHPSQHVVAHSNVMEDFLQCRDKWMAKKLEASTRGVASHDQRCLLAVVCNRFQEWVMSPLVSH